LIITKSGILGIVIVVACSVGGMSAPTTAIKPIDPGALQDTLDALVRDLMVPGAMVLLRTPQGEFAFGSGTTELGVTRAPRADTHFRIASNTKTMTAAVIVLLAQDGKLRFDDSVSKHVSGVPNGDNITIAELLTMRSGLYNYTAAPELAESLDREPTKAWTAEELLAIAFKRPPPSAPGKEFDYCNTNYVLLGLIAEKIEGEALARIFQKRLFAPLGMTDTLLPANTSSTLPSRTRMATCMVARHMPWWTRPILPICKPRPRPGRSSPTTTQCKIRPIAWEPVAPSPRRMICRPGCAPWSGARFSMPTINANGSRALYRRIQASRWARNTVMASP
jgi:CubicO group peptidase (beta-lactamase class C family)